MFQFNSSKWIRGDKFLGRVVSSLAVVFAISAGPAMAVPVAYWRFEGDGVTTPTVGVQVEDTDGRTTTATGVGIRAIDATGNGNTLWAWEQAFAGHTYQADVSNATVTSSGAPNGFSVQNAGGFPALFSWSVQSSPTVNVETIAPAQWTIEASVKPTTVGGGFRTIVGREGNGVTGDPNLAPFYLQITDTGQFRINYTDAAGVNHIVTSPDNVLAHQWYNLAATSNGSTLSLYVDSFDGTGYQLEATADLTGSANSAMINPGLDLNGDTWGWTVARGRYGNSDDPTADHTDRFLGFVDEVRISDDAVAPGSFLFAGANAQAGPRLTIDRSTGTFTLTNLQASMDVVSYNLTSASGALNPLNWRSVTDNSDGDSGATFDMDDAWTITSNTSLQLSEVELAGDGGQLGSVQLGLANAWRRSRFEDLVMTIDQLLPDFSIRTFNVPIVFTGGTGQYVRSDLNLDGVVNGLDWNVFTANHLTDLSAKTVAEASVFGDLDGNLANDFIDFRLFQQDYDALNGLGAFAAMLSAVSVPEPTGVLLAMGCCGPLFLSRRRRQA